MISCGFFVHILYVNLNFFNLSLYAIIVAGGSGSRMQTSIPKQFIKIGQLPVLMHTILRFYSFSPELIIILVLPEQEMPAWKNLCKEYNFNIPVQIVPGGVTRFHSVQNGLAAIPGDDGMVAVHDGVRPFVSLQTIRESFEVASDKGCAVAVVPLKDSIRAVNEAGNTFSVDRNTLRLVQTPQTFRLSLLKESYARAENASLFTDDASVAEKAGYPIFLIPGSYQNIKITTPEDLIWAESLLSLKQ